MTREFLPSEHGSVAIMFALACTVLIGLAGFAIDYTRAESGRQSLQNAVDAATLAAANKTEKAEQDKIFANVLSSNVVGNSGLHVVPASLKLTSESNRLTGRAEGIVRLTLAKVLGMKDFAVKAEATVNTEKRKLEIAMVLDVSSSMVEEGRFDPMKDAAKTFVSTIAAATDNLKDIRITIVPFSSRVNPGLQNTGFLRSWGGNPAVPDRWVNPGAYYGSSYVRYDWIDGQNFAMYNGKNYYWMGCVEPRLDFAIHAGEATGPALGEGSPSGNAFLAMDYNPKSGLSFCPPPVTPLTDSETELSSAVDALTPQGSTRLDAGILAGWYALSPQWSSAWPGSSGPGSYSKTTRKIAVFMTDGKMNTQDDSSGKHYDWVCEAVTDCDDYATGAFLNVCDAMKAKEITVYSVAYDPDADSDVVRKCATNSDFFYQATSSGGQAYIESIYASVATHILANGPALVR